MRTLVTSRPAKLSILLACAAACLALFGYMWTTTGASLLPGMPDNGYQLKMHVKDVDNAVANSDVQIAGVQVGKIKSVTQGEGHATVTFQIDDQYAPLHQGVTATIGAKSLVGESYVDIEDGSGRALASGATIPPSNVKPGVQLNDVLASLDAKSRESLSDTLRSLRVATGGTRESVGQLLAGMGKLGREGHTALDAIAAQSTQLKQMARQTSEVLAALNTRQGQIVTLAENAERLTDATAGERGHIEAAMRQMPTTLASARVASQELSGLSHSLAPVAQNLNRAAPDLDMALRQLPATARDLRAMLPSLDATLTRAPATLRRVPTFSQDVRNLIPQARDMFAEINPMLGYIRPYGHDLAALFTNWGAAWNYADSSGKKYLRLDVAVNGSSTKVYPTPLRVKEWTNAYPDPGTSPYRGPFTGEYPRLERQPR